MKVPYPTTSLGRSFLILLLSLSPSIHSSAQQDQGSRVPANYSDGQILKILQVLNDAELEQASLAQEQAQSRQVQNAATRIINDHEGSNDRISVLADMGIELQQSPMGQGLQAQAEESMNQLSGLSGTEFDCVFLQKQIDQHQLAIDSVANVLLPAVQDAEVEQLLSVDKPALQQHLEMAQQALQSMDECSN